MNDKDLHAKKYRAQIDEWSADLAALKAKAKGASADAQIELSQMIESLEGSIKVANSKLAELGDASEDAWDQMKKKFEEGWESLKMTVQNTYRKMKDKA